MGVQYPGDHSQPNVIWKVNSRQIFIEQQHDWSEKLKTYSLILYRESNTSGNWAEAYPKSPPNSKNSLISYTGWNSDNSSVLTYQNFEYKVTSSFQILGGLKYEGKRLTKNYDIPGYYNAFSTYPYLNDSKFFLTVSELDRALISIILDHLTLKGQCLKQIELTL
jgi:outer membrane receptor for ferrienterochelin and colicins